MKVVGSYGIQQLIDDANQPASVKAALQGINTLLYMEASEDLGSVAMLSNVGILRYDTTPTPAGTYLYTNTNTSFPPINDASKWTRITPAVVGATTTNITSWSHTINAGYGIASGLLSNQNKVPAMRGHLYYAWDTRQLYIYAPDSNLGATTLGWRLLSDNSYAAPGADYQRQLGVTRILVPSATGTAFSFAGKQLKDSVQLAINQVQWLDGNPPSGGGEAKWTNPPTSDQLIGSLVWDNVNNIFGIVYSPLVSNVNPATFNVRIILVVGDATISIVDEDDPTVIHGSFTTNQATSADIAIPHVGDGTITFQNSDDDTTDLDSFSVNQDADKVIKLGNATITLTNVDGTTDYGEFTANASQDVDIALPNAANDGKITIQDDKASPATPSTFGTFTVDQAGDTTISIPAVYDATITIDDEDQHASPGTGNHGTFTVNQSGDKTITIPAVRNATITLQAARDTTTAEIGHFTLNQGANETLDIGNATITLTNEDGTTEYGTFGVNDTASKSIALASQANDATISIVDKDDPTIIHGSFTVDQATDASIEIPSVYDTQVRFIGYGLDGQWIRDDMSLNAPEPSATQQSIDIPTAMYNALYVDISQPIITQNDCTLPSGYIALSSTANLRRIQEHLEWIGYNPTYDKNVSISGPSSPGAYIAENINFTGIAHGLFANEVAIDQTCSWYIQLRPYNGAQHYQREITLDPTANNSGLVEKLFLNRATPGSGYEHSINAVASSTSNATSIGAAGSNLKYTATQLVSTSSDSSITESLMDTAGSTATGFKQDVTLSGNSATDSRSLSIIGSDTPKYSRSTELNPLGTGTHYLKESLLLDTTNNDGYTHTQTFSSGMYEDVERYARSGSELMHTRQIDAVGPTQSFTLEKLISAPDTRDRALFNQALYSMNLRLSGSDTAQSALLSLSRATDSNPASSLGIILVDDTSRLTATLASARYSYPLKAATDLLQKQDASSIIADAQAAINNSTIRLEYANGQEIGTFTLNQVSDLAIKLDDVNDGQIRILAADGTACGSFTVNQSNNTAITLPAVQKLYRHTIIAQVDVLLPSRTSVTLQFTLVLITKYASPYALFSDVCLAASKMDETSYGPPSWVSMQFVPQAVTNATEQIIDAKYSFLQDQAAQFKSKMTYTIADVSADGVISNMVIAGNVDGNTFRSLTLLNDSVSTYIMQ